MYTVHKDSKRQRWAFEVRWNGGRCIARCDCEVGAEKIANSLNETEPHPFKEADKRGAAMFEQLLQPVQK